MAKLLLNVILVCTFLSAQLVAEPIRLPELNSDSERLSFLLFLQEHIPGIFEKSARYGVNVLEQLENQQQLEARFAEDEDFRALLPHWNGLKEITIEARGEGTVRTQVIDPQALVAWRQGLENTINDIRGNHLGQALQSAIRARTTLLSRRNPNSFLIGLVSAIPEGSLPPGNSVSEKRAAVFRMDEAERSAYLQTALPENLIGSVFRANQFGINRENFSPAQALSMLGVLQRRQQELVNLTQVHLLLQNDQGQIGTRDQALTRIRNLGEGDIDLLRDGHVYMERLGRLAEATDNLTLSALTQTVGGPTSPIRRDGSIVSYRSSGAMANAVDALQNQTVERVQQIQGRLRIYQVPPFAGRFRGCVGGDCSTGFDAQFANSPLEKVFYIEDSRGARGYVAATLIEVNGVRSLYVHTIAGRINTAETMMILRGLYEERAALGAQQIVLPTRNRVGSLINTSEIQQGFYHHIDGRDQIDLSYLDENLRGRLGSSGYDSPSVNPHGHIYRPEDTPDVEIRTNSGDADFPEYEAQPIQRWQAFLFALDLHHVDATSSVNRVLRIPGVNLSRAEFDTAANLLENRGHDSLARYYANSARVLRQFGVRVNEDFISERAYIFWKGHLNSSDVTNPDHFSHLPQAMQRRTLDFVIGVIDELDEHDATRIVRDVVTNNARFFSQAQPLLRRLGRMVRMDPPDAPDLRVIAALLDMGIDHSSLAIQLRPLLARLHDTNEEIRDLAHEIVGKVRYWSNEDLQVIERDLNHEDSQRRDRALQLLIRIRPTDSDYQQHLIRTLLQNSSDVHQRIFGEVRSLSKEAAELLQPHLDSEDGRVREFVEEALRHPHESAELNRTLLLRVLQDDSGEEAARWSATFGEQSIESLRLVFHEIQMRVHLGSDKMAKKAVNFYGALHKDHQPTTLVLVRELLKPNTNEALREVLASVLRNIRSTDPIAQRLLVQAASGNSNELAHSALDVLMRWELADPAIQRALVELWFRENHGGTSLGQRVGEVIGAIRGEFHHESRLAQALDHADTAVRTRTARLLGQNVPSSEAVHRKLAEKFLVAQTNDERDSLARTLELALPPAVSVHRVLAQALLSSDTQTRALTLKIFERVKPDNPQVQYQIAKRAVIDSNEANRNWARQALQQIEQVSALAIRYLWLKLDRGTDNERIQAAETLADVHNTDQSTHLRLAQVIADANVSQAVRSAAVQSLQQILRYHQDEVSRHIDAQTLQVLAPIVQNLQDPVRSELVELLSICRCRDSAARGMMLDLIDHIPENLQDDVVSRAAQDADVDEQTRRRLADLISHSNADVRYEALRYFDSVENGSLTQIELEALSRGIAVMIENGDDQYRVQTLIRTIGDNANQASTVVVNRLVAALPSLHDDLRVGAYQALGDIGNSSAIPALLTVVEDKEAKHRRAAAAALAKITLTDRHILERLGSAIKSDEALAVELFAILRASYRNSDDETMKASIRQTLARDLHFYDSLGPNEFPLSERVLTFFEVEGLRDTNVMRALGQFISNSSHSENRRIQAMRTIERIGWAHPWVIDPLLEIIEGNSRAAYKRHALTTLAEMNTQSQEVTARLADALHRRANEGLRSRILSIILDLGVHSDGVYRSLASLSTHPDPETRKNVIRAITHRQNRSGPAQMRAILAFANDSDEDVQVRVATALRNSGDGAFPDAVAAEIIRAYPHARTAVQEAIVTEFLERGFSAAQLGDVFLEGLNNSNAEVRRATCELCARASALPESVLGRLVALVLSPEPSVRAQALLAISQQHEAFGDLRLADVISQGLSDSQPSVRQAALAAANVHGLPPGANLYLAHADLAVELESNDNQRIRAALEVLTGVEAPTERIFNALLHILDSTSDDRLKQQVISTLNNQNNLSPAMIRSLAQSISRTTDPVILPSLLMIVQRTEVVDRSLLPVLENLVRNGPENLRQMVAYSLGRFSVIDPQLPIRLSTLLDSRNPQTRIIGARLLADAQATDATRDQLLALQRRAAGMMREFVLRPPAILENHLQVQAGWVLGALAEASPDDIRALLGQLSPQNMSRFEAIAAAIHQVPDGQAGVTEDHRERIAFGLYSLSSGAHPRASSAAYLLGHYHFPRAVPRMISYLDLGADSLRANALSFFYGLNRPNGQAARALHAHIAERLAAGEPIQAWEHYKTALLRLSGLSDDGGNLRSVMARMARMSDSCEGDYSALE